MRGSAAPHIGIFPTLTSNNYTGAYQDWVAEFGATSTVLPSRFDEPDQLEKIFLSINGFLIPGGGESLSPSARAMIERAVKAHKSGTDYFPVWGTCLGFEWIVETFGGRSAIHHGFDSEHYPAPLHFTSHANSSRTYASASPDLLAALQHEAITYNAHSAGITPTSFASNTGLSDTFSVLSTSTDRNGRPFVAQIEGKDGLPIYGNQFHPEKIEFVPKSRDYPNIPRSKDAVAAARELASFFVSEARKNKHQTGSL